MPSLTAARLKKCGVSSDVIVRTRLMELIEKKYGKENIYVLMKSEYTSLGDIFGYKTIGYSREERKKFFSRLKKMYQLNTMGFSTYINVEFANDITVGNLFIPERIGRKDLNWQVERNNKYYTKSYVLKNEYVINQIKIMADEILEEKFSYEDLIPNLRYLFPVKEESIVISVGSTGRDKVCSPNLLSKFILEIREIYKDEKIKLVGNGKLQQEYAKKIIEILNDKNMENLVDKTSIKEVFEEVAKSKLFLGFDSGLYNACFALRKKGIGLFKNKQGSFIHSAPWIKIVYPKEIKEEIEDKEYPGLEINSITVDEFKKALKGIKDEKYSY